MKTFSDFIAEKKAINEDESAATNSVGDGNGSVKLHPTPISDVVKRIKPFDFPVYDDPRTNADASEIDKAKFRRKQYLQANYS